MITKKIELDNHQRYNTNTPVSREKLLRAAQIATDNLEKNLQRFTDNFASSATENLIYRDIPNVDWINGMHTGLYWLAYELTGNKRFRDVAEHHLKSFQKRFDDKIELNSHDLGFLYSPSCVAAYKVTGNEQARKLAIDAAEYLYQYSYTEKGGFIIRANGHSPMCYEDYRTMMDTLMNIPLFLWAYEETGIEKYRDAAISQYKITEKYLVREDASTFHHYQFSPQTDEPVKGVTWQGYSDDSCWARGQAWGIYGIALAYSYTKDETLKELQRDLTYYFLNRTPSGNIPCWDLIFTQDSNEPLDSSASAIAICGMNEMNKYMPDDSLQKIIFENASNQMIEALIDKCAYLPDSECDGILRHCTHALPQGIGIDECSVYGDYFYLEALMRFLNPTWKCYW